MERDKGPMGGLHAPLAALGLIPLCPPKPGGWQRAGPFLEAYGTRCVCVCRGGEAPKLYLSASVTKASRP